jgi:hypothetical protein
MSFPWEPPAEETATLALNAVIEEFEAEARAKVKIVRRM